MSTRLKTITAFIALVILVILLFGLIKQLIDSLKIEDRIKKEVGELTILQEENAELKKRLTEVKSLAFIEEQARNKLLMGREGETVIIIPEEEIQKVIASWQKKEEIKLPNWQGWLRLFWK